MMKLPERLEAVQPGCRPLGSCYGGRHHPIHSHFTSEESHLQNHGSYPAKMNGHHNLLTFLASSGLHTVMIFCSLRNLKTTFGTRKPC